MAEPKRIEEEFPTAELASYDTPSKHSDGPKLVNGQERATLDRLAAVSDKRVAAVIERLTEGFANEPSGLEKQWDRGDHVSTEDWRVALRRHRSFFDC
jgi:hypothetical protein